MKKLLSGLFGLAVLGSLTATAQSSLAGEYNLTVDPITIRTHDFTKTGVGYNGSSYPTVLHWKEGEDVVINVKNNLKENTSIHWHGLIVPFDQDGVPGISFRGIPPGGNFTYRFKIKQAGTYWFHSHSGFQEPDGAYGAIVISSKTREPFRYDKEYVIQLTDAHPMAGSRVMRNLKMLPDYFNRKQRTFGDLVSDIAQKGFKDTLSDRLAWGGMRMTPTDIEDVQGFTPLINGKDPQQNWTGLFRPGERVRLRFINSSAMTYFDVRIPGLKMTVVQADGNNVQPVPVDRFRIAVAETYDVIVQPRENRPYTIFAESMGRSAFARATLATHQSETATIPEISAPPRLTMADMGMAGMDMGGMSSSADEQGSNTMAMPGMSGMDHSTMDHTMEPSGSSDPFYAKGSGLDPTNDPDVKFLSYQDLKAQKPLYPPRAATREIELRLTGNMERYSWSINGVKYEDAEPIRLKYGERVRFKFVNETMMTHPMHLHGMWSILDNGNGKWNPVKHVISVAPGATVYSETEVDAPGQWAFHCHLSYHASSGMFRKVIVEGTPETAGTGTPLEAKG